MLQLSTAREELAAKIRESPFFLTLEVRSCSGLALPARPNARLRFADLLQPSQMPPGQHLPLHKLS